MIPKAQLELWHKYCELERKNIRSEFLPALDQFIASLVQLPSEEWHEWALDLARRVVDVDTDTKVRVPLFQSVLFPALLAGLEDSRPGCARWLSAFIQLIYQLPSCSEQLPEHQRTEIGLLRTALSHDSHDHMTRRKLIKALAHQLNYAIHEVPSGVLWDHNSANIEQCSELRVGLDDSCRLVATEGIIDDHQNLIDECRFHFIAYPDYLSNIDKYNSYSQYLHEVHDA